MSAFGDYPPNVVPRSALVVRQQDSSKEQHAVVPYSGEELSKRPLGPANPFRGSGSDTTDAATRKRTSHVLTGTVDEALIGDAAFRAKHRAVERQGGPEREYRTGREIKAANKAIRARREAKGDASIVDAEGEYIGPWARHGGSRRIEEEEEEVELGSDEEYEIVEEEEVEEEPYVAPSGLVTRPQRDEETAAAGKEKGGTETTTFHGESLTDYQGRTYMHVPQDLDVDLRKEVGSITNYIPKKLVHTWKNHTKAVTALRFFPESGHLLLSASADNTVKIWDVYHQRSLLRTYLGHNKAVSDICFNNSGSQFLSASYDRMMKLWDTETGACINRFTTGKTPHVVRFNPSPEYNHEFLAGMSDKKIVQFDTRTREVVQEYDHHLAAVNTITFVDENRRFITTSDDKSLRAWDYNIPVPIKYIAEPYMYPMTRSAAHPSGKYVAFQSSDNQIVVYGATDKFRQNRKKGFRGHNNAGLAIDITCSPDGQFLASGDSGGFVCFWDWKTCKMYHKFQASDQAVTCVQWHPQETSKVATAGLQGDIKFWD